MATLETKVFEDAQMAIYQQVSSETHPDGRPYWTGIRTAWKPGSPGSNSDDLTAKAQQALALNGTFLAIATPTNAQSVAQVQRLTRECNAIIRMLLGQLDTTTDT